MATETPERLADAGTALLLLKGFRGTGLQELLTTAGVPKGSLYHHFGSKLGFTRAAVERYFAQQGKVLAEARSADGSPRERLRRYFGELADGFERAGWAHGCLLGTLGQEMAGSDEGLRVLLAGCFDTWVHGLVALVGDALAERGDARAPDELAAFIVDAWEGALLQAKVQRSRAPLNRFDSIVFQELLP